MRAEEAHKLALDRQRERLDYHLEQIKVVAESGAFAMEFDIALNDWIVRSLILLGYTVTPIISNVKGMGTKVSW